MIDKTYRCNLCHDMYPVHKLIGLHSDGRFYKEIEPMRTENHLCYRCVCSIQQFTERCGQGLECAGGPNCGSDHK